MDKRLLMVILITAAASGLVVGNIRSRNSTSIETRESETAKGLASHHPTGSARSEFLLLPADVQADRETPALAIDAKGRILLAFASQTAPLERTLYLSHSTDGKAFDPPTPFRKVPIYKYAASSGSRNKGDAEKKDGEPEKPAMTYSTHILPRLVALGDEISLGWVEAIDGGPRVVYYVAKSLDGGKIFSAPVPTHGPNASKPGFTALASGRNGEIEAAWMDGGKPITATRRPGSDGFEAESVVYPGPPSGGGICPCCDLAVTRPAVGPGLVAFRNNDGDIRDIWIGRAAGDGSQPARPVGDHRWKFKGCPHDGPSLASQGGRVQVALMDAYSGVNRVYFAYSDPESLAFSLVELSSESKGAQSHPRLAPIGAGLLAVWDESVEPATPVASTDAGQGHGHGATPATLGGGRAVRISHASDSRTFGKSEAVDPRPGSFQINPTVVAMPDGEALAAWNEFDSEGKRVVVVKVKPPSH